LARCHQNVGRIASGCTNSACHHGFLVSNRLRTLRAARAFWYVTMNRGILAILMFSLTSDLAAYENACTHPKITSRAVDLLNTPTPTPYSELSVFQHDLLFGAQDEDNPTLAVLNHFYDPRNRKPLNIPGNDTAIGIITLGNQQDALTRASGYWQQAVTKYKANSKDTAYILMGRVLHLITQDMAQPGHTQNDPHIPYLVYNYPGLDGSDASILEESAENLCNSSGDPFPQGTGVLMATPGLYNQSPTLTK
jgi:hypothetical protein